MSTVVVGCHTNSPYALALALALFEKRGVVDIVQEILPVDLRAHLAGILKPVLIGRFQQK